MVDSLKVQVPRLNKPNKHKKTEGVFCDHRHKLNVVKMLYCDKAFKAE